MHKRRKLKYTVLLFISLVVLLQGSQYIITDMRDVTVKVSSKTWLDTLTERLHQRKPTLLLDEEVPYIFALSYMEQLVNGIGNLFQLGHIGKELDARLVVPQVSASRLYGLSNFIPSGCAGFTNPLSDYIDIDLLATRSCNISISPLEDFLKFSPRQIVLFHPVRGVDYKRVEHKISSDKYFMELLNPVVEKDLRDCLHVGACSCKDQLYNIINGIEGALNSLAHSRSLPNFTIRNAICFNGDKTISLNDLLQHRTVNESKVSYIFTHWTGNRCSLSVEEGQNECVSTSRHGGGIHLLSSSKRTSHSCKDLKSRLATSIHTHIEELSARFLRAQGITPHNHLITVHVRLEKLTSMATCCLQKMLSRVRQLKQTLPNSKVVLITDLGPLGSHSCGEGHCRYLKALSMQIFSANNITPVYFDAVQYGVKNDSALASLVEMLAVAKGNEVILVGGGQFQATLLQRILARVEVGHENSTRHLYSICSGSTLNHLPNLSKELTSAISYNIFKRDKCKYY